MHSFMQLAHIGDLFIKHSFMQCNAQFLLGSIFALATVDPYAKATMAITITSFLTSPDDLFMAIASSSSSSLQYCFFLQLQVKMEKTSIDLYEEAETHSCFHYIN